MNSRIVKIECRYTIRLKSDYNRSCGFLGNIRLSRESSARRTVEKGRFTRGFQNQGQWYRQYIHDVEHRCYCDLSKRENTFKLKR